MEGEKLYSIPEAARFLGGISKWTIHSWLSKGKLQRTKVGGRTMIRAGELAKMIEDGGTIHEASKKSALTAPMFAGFLGKRKKCTDAERLALCYSAVPPVGSFPCLKERFSG